MDTDEIVKRLDRLEIIMGQHTSLMEKRFDALETQLDRLDVKLEGTITTIAWIQRVLRRRFEQVGVEQ
jgi:hypothetical protein